MKKHKLILNGKEVTEEEFHRGGKIGGSGIPMISRNVYTDVRPWVSESLGVLPSQVQEERQNLAKEKEQGRLTGVHIRDNGAVECTSKKEQGRLGWMKYRGAIDTDGGYSETYNSRS